MSIKEVIETVKKTVLKYLPLSANMVQRCIDGMAEDVEKTLTSVLRHRKFSIQLNESTHNSSNILMAYAKYFSSIQNQIINYCSKSILDAM